MQLTDIQPLEKWAELEKDIHEKSGMDANVFNTDGIRITDVKNWVNRLCPAIKDTDRGQAFICAVAHMNLSILANNSQQPVIEECDAGIVKIVVPIIVSGEFLGAVGACGCVLEDGEVDDFMINKTTGIPEDTIASLAETVKTITHDKAESVAAYIESRILDLLGE